MREKIINMMNTRTVDLQMFYQYFLDNGGQHISKPIFEQAFHVFYNSCGREIECIFEKMCIRYEINILKSKDGKFIKAL